MKKEVTINTFDGGLMLDLNPISVPNNVLTDCLNGTLITFQGDEQMLQNDMGNARVETAMLPEGYIPIGTCSHGGFIYIVSYNPIKNLAQIGSFPSPERNIDTTELKDNTIQDFKFDDIKLDGDTYKIDNDTLYPLKPSIRKVFSQIDLNPGDKFIVFTHHLNGCYLSDYGSSNNTIDSIPRLWKIRIAAVQDNKSTELTNLKWYPVGTDLETSIENTNSEDIDKVINSGNYYIKEQKDDLSTRGNEPIDVDDYRSLVNGAYSIFTSKKSGKLVLLISPECPDAYSASWSAYVSASPTVKNTQKYDIYINSSWQNGGRDVNPEGVIVKATKISEGLKFKTEGNIEETNPIKTSEEFDSKTEGDIKKEDPSKTPFDKTNYLIIPFNHSRKQSDNSFGEDEYVPFKDRLKKEEWYKILQEDKGKSFVNNKYIHREYLNARPTGNYYISVDSSDYVDKNENGLPDLPEEDPNYYYGEVKDDYLNNFFNIDVPLKLGEFTVPKDIQDGDTNYIIELEVIPYTKAGYFPHLARKLIIDFSKIGKEKIKLNKWKYWVTEDSLLLDWGLEAYTLPNKMISKVWLEFYDAQGLAATQILDGLSSYNMDFQTNINLGRSSTYNGIGPESVDRINTEIYYRYKEDGLDEGKAKDYSYHNPLLAYHRGLELTITEQDKENAGNKHGVQGQGQDQDRTRYAMLDKLQALYPKYDYNNSSYNTWKTDKNSEGEPLYPDGEPWWYFLYVYERDGYIICDRYIKNGDTDKTILYNPNRVYINDSGIIYPNVLYCVVLKYQLRDIGTFNSVDEQAQLLDYRWMWTCPIFNEYYDTTNDFIDLHPELKLDVNVQYGSTDTYKALKNNYSNLKNVSTSPIEDYSGQISANIQYITGEGNVESKAAIGLQNNYNTFRIAQDKLNKFILDCAIGDMKVEKSIPQPKIIQEEIAGNPKWIQTPEVISNNITLTSKQNYILGLSNSYEDQDGDIYKWQIVSENKFNLVDVRCTINEDKETGEKKVTGEIEVPVITTNIQYFILDGKTYQIKEKPITSNETQYYVVYEGKEVYINGQEEFTLGKYKCNKKGSTLLVRETIPITDDVLTLFGQYFILKGHQLLILNPNVYNFNFKDETNKDDIKYTYYSVVNDEVKDLCKLASFQQNYDENSNGIATNTFTFNALHYSKYFTTGDNSENVTLSICQTPVRDVNDLIKYNLTIAEIEGEPTVMFNKYVFMNNDRSPGGHQSQHYIGWGTCSYDTRNKVFQIDPSSKIEDTKDQSRVNYSDLIKDQSDAIAQICDRLNFFFPVLVGSQYSGTQNSLYNVDTNYPEQYREPVEKKISKTSNTLELNQTGGFIGAISGNTIVCDFARPISSTINRSLLFCGSAFTFYAKIILGLLTQIYAKNQERISKTVYSLDKFTYYEPHSSNYLADVIYKLYTKENANANSMITLGNTPDGFAARYSYYLGRVIDSVHKKYPEIIKAPEKAPEDETKKEEATEKEEEKPTEAVDNNVNFTIVEITKNCPIQFKFDYITPDLAKNDYTRKCIVQSLTSLNDSLVNCDDDVLYVEEGGELVPLSGAHEFTCIQNIKDGLIQPVTSKIDYLKINGLILSHNEILKAFTISLLGDNYLKYDTNGLSLQEGVDSLAIANSNMIINTNIHGECQIKYPTKIKFFDIVSTENKDQIYNWEFGNPHVPS